MRKPSEDGSPNRKEKTKSDHPKDKSMNAAEAIRKQNRIRELMKMNKGQLEALSKAVENRTGIHTIYGKPKTKNGLLEYIVELEYQGAQS